MMNDQLLKHNCKLQPDSDKYECEQSPTGEHLHGTYYCSLSGSSEFVYSDEKDKYKGKQNYCEFNFCPFCGEGLTDKVNE